MSEVKLNHLTTERRNEKTMNLDTLSTHELLEIMITRFLKRFGKRFRKLKKRFRRSSKRCAAADV